MTFDDDRRGRPWVVGEIDLAIWGPGALSPRTIRVRRPFATIGSGAGSDVRVEGPTVESRHVVLLLNRRGVFGVDLRTAAGTTFSGTARDSAWLGVGDSIGVGESRVELVGARVDGSSVDPPRPVGPDDDPLADAPGRVGLVLEPIGTGGPSWMLGSSLAFAGRGPACAVRVEHPSTSAVHCGFYRTESRAYVFEIEGRSTLVDGRPVVGASPLEPGDLLSIGEARFVVRVDRAIASAPAPSPPRVVPIGVDPPLPGSDPGSGGSAAWLLDRLRATERRRGQPAARSRRVVDGPTARSDPQSAPPRQIAQDRS